MLKVRHTPRDEEPTRKAKVATVVLASAIALLVAGGVAHPVHNQALKMRHEPMGPTTSTS